VRVGVCVCVCVCVCATLEQVRSQSTATIRELHDLDTQLRGVRTQLASVAAAGGIQLIAIDADGRAPSIVSAACACPSCTLLYYDPNLSDTPAQIEKRLGVLRSYVSNRPCASNALGSPVRACVFCASISDGHCRTGA
jgi:hypothetical protein